MRYLLTEAEYNYSYGIVLALDPFTEQAIRSIWGGLEQAGITSSLPSIACAQPHITLGIFPDLNLDCAKQRLPEYADIIRPFTVGFSSLGVFPTVTGASVFLQPTVTEELLSTHQSFYSHLAKVCGQLSDYYLPGRWVPHCSVGIGLSREIASDTLEYCFSLDLPIYGQVQDLVLLEMVTQNRQVISGCEVARYGLGTGNRLPAPPCPHPSHCLFAERYLQLPQLHI